MDSNPIIPLKPMSLWQAFLMFAVPSALQTTSMYIILPMIAARVTYPILWWFLLCYLTPLSLMLPASYIAFRLDGLDAGVATGPVDDARIGMRGRLTGGIEIGREATARKRCGPTVPSARNCASSGSSTCSHRGIAAPPVETDRSLKPTKRCVWGGSWLTTGRSKCGRVTSLILAIVRNAAPAASAENRFRADPPERKRFSGRTHAVTASGIVSRQRCDGVYSRGQPANSLEKRDPMHDSQGSAHGGGHKSRSTSRNRATVHRRNSDAQSRLRVGGRMVQDWVQSLPLVELLARLDINVHRNQEVCLELLIVHLEQLLCGKHGCRARREPVDQQIGRAHV